MIALFIISIFYFCQIQSYWYSYNAAKISDKVDEMNCYNESVFHDAIKCDNLIAKHNMLVGKWDNLSCINSKLEPLEIRDNPRIVEIVLQNDSAFLLPS